MAKTNRKPKIDPLEKAREFVASRERKVDDNGLPTALCATPERMVKAGADIAVGADNVQRVTADPLDRLFRRGQLDRDKERNGVLYQAGVRYRDLWWQSGLGRSTSSLNITGVFTPATERNPGMPASEAQAHARAKLREARDRLGFYFARVVDPIVLEGVDVEDVGKSVTGRGHAQQARAVALDRLAEGLRLLALHFTYIRT